MNALIDMLRLFFHRRFYSQEQIRSYQLKELKKLTAYAIEHAPYYAQTLRPYPFTSLEDFRSLPKMDKSILMDHFDTINTEGVRLDEAMAFALRKEIDKDYLGYYKDRFVVGLSSGTSGNKGLILTDKAMTRKLPFVFLARGGLPLSLLPFRILFCLRVFSQGFNDINSPLVSLHYAPTMTPPEDLIKAINARNINILMAPPSLLRVLLPYSDQIRVKLKRIVCFAEVLEKEEKQRFETVYKTKVIEIYQASEGQMASACPHGNLHINEDLVYVELLDKDGKPVQAHQVAHSMLVTNLVNRVQPLIRYEMNDLIVLKDSCTCGSHFRTIETIVGRHDDVLIFKTRDGKDQVVFPDLFSRWIITSSDAIREFRVCLKNKDQLRIEVDCFESTLDLSGVLKNLEDRIHRELNTYGIVCTMDVVHAKIGLPQEKSKMKRFFVENV